MSLEKLTEYAEHSNIALDLDEEYLRKLGRIVVEEYDIDEASRKEWKDRQEEASKLAAQLVEPKNSPWPGASNVKYPLLAEAALQFNARAYPALVPGTDIVKARTVGFDPDGSKLDSAIRVSKHMSYQLLDEMEEWEEDQDKLLMSLPIVGCMFKKTYYDSIKKRHRSEIIYPEDFVVNYGTKSLEDCYRATHILYRYDRDIKIMQANALYLDIDLTQAVRELNKPKDEILGMTQPKVNDATQRKVLEQHRYEDLDGDGLSEPYIVTVDYDSNAVLRIVAGYSQDSIKTNPIDESIIDVEKDSYFTKFGMIPNPDGGFYDIGFGVLLSPVNNVVDTLINQLIDGGTLSNMASGFLSRSIRLRKGETRLKPGEWKTVNTTGDDLKKGIMPIPSAQPSNVLFQLLGMMVQAGQKLASTTDPMTGENPGQNQKATTTLAVIEQGSKVFTGVYKRLHRSMKQELKKLSLLNYKYLPAEAYFTVLDLPMPFENVEAIRRIDYDPKNVNVLPAADSQVSSSQQKMAKAQALIEFNQATGALNPQEVTRRYLEATEQPAIDVLMDVPPAPPSIESLEFEHRSRLEWARFQLDVIKAEQDEAMLQADIIQKLADAEAKEAGMQIDTYTAQMEAIRSKSEDMENRIKEIMDDPDMMEIMGGGQEQPQ